jgi:hypothetical protein
MRKVIKFIIQIFISPKKKVEIGSLAIDPNGRLMYSYTDGYGKVESLVEVVTYVKKDVCYKVTLEEKPKEGLNND